MKVESLVIVDQHATVNLYLGLVLPARHAPEVEWIGSLGNACTLLPLSAPLYPWYNVPLTIQISGPKRGQSLRRFNRDKELLGN